MASSNGSGAGARCHIVLVPGFGGFDALGRVEYYASVTGVFDHWMRRHGRPPVVLHYFDNLPTAAVVTRAERLRRYLAKRIARGEIAGNDRIVLVGHSTGGLDIRRLICDLHKGDAYVHVDGGLKVETPGIRERLNGVVFLSVPHWGTNIADWVCSHTALRKIVIGFLQTAFGGSRVCALGELEAAAACGAARYIGADLLLAVRDALTETNDRAVGRDPSRIADAQEAASELELYFRHMATDFRVIGDLASRGDQSSKSPAHFDDWERAAELDLWKKQPAIRSLSYATVGGRPFGFASSRPAPPLDLTDACAWREIAGEQAGTDVSFRLCYRACAGGPFRWPEMAGTVSRILGPPPPDPLEVWDNDGIVNTASMLWPGDENTLVVADHLDIVGHYRLEFAHEERGEGDDRRLRTYRSYDSLESAPLFTEKAFRDVWTEIFSFAAMRGEFERNRKSRAAAATHLTAAVR